MIDSEVKVVHTLRLNRNDDIRQKIKKHISMLMMIMMMIKTTIMMMMMDCIPLSDLTIQTILNRNCSDLFASHSQT